MRLNAPAMTMRFFGAASAINSDFVSPSRRVARAWFSVTSRGLRTFGYRI
jgi:hypothetical protein